MDIIAAIILGIIQGLTEFIPISSTAHLTIAGDLMGLIDPVHPEKWTAFIATIQLGTMAAVLIYFKKEIIEIPPAFLKENLTRNRKKFTDQSLNSRIGWLIITGSVPIVIVGLSLKGFFEGNFTKEPAVIASSLIGLAIILFIAERTANFRKGIDDISLKDSVLIGIAQCIALIPGSSRSGTTITAGLFLGINRENAARFSFLLSIPAVFASGILEFYSSLRYISASEIFILAVAIVASAASGYVSIAFLINYLKKRTTSIFIIYRIIAGLIIFLLIMKNII